MKKRIISFLTAMLMVISLFVPSANLSFGANEIVITSDQMNQNQYETFYYLDSESFIYNGHPVTFKNNSTVTVNGTDYPLKNKKISYSVTDGNDDVFNPGEAVQLTLSSVDTPVGYVAGQWNVSFGGYVQSIYESNLSALTSVKSKLSATNNGWGTTYTYMANTFEIAIPEDADKNLILSKGQVFEKANAYSPGISGIGKEGYFGRLPNIEIPIHTGQSSNEKTVSIRIVGYNGDIIERQNVTVDTFNLDPYLTAASGSSATPSSGWDVDKFPNGPSHSHALVKVLENYNADKPAGEKIPYELQDYGWGLYLTMINNEREFDQTSSSGWMYDVDGALPNVGAQGKLLEDGQVITWYFSAHGYDHILPKMTLDKANVEQNEQLTVTIIDQHSNTPVKDAIITLNGQETSYKTDDSGQVSLKIVDTGDYNLSAVHYKNDHYDMIHPESITIKVNPGAIQGSVYLNVKDGNKDIYNLSEVNLLKNDTLESLVSRALGIQSVPVVTSAENPYFESIGTLTTSSDKVSRWVTLVNDKNVLDENNQLQDIKDITLSNNDYIEVLYTRNDGVDIGVKNEVVTDNELKDLLVSFEGAAIDLDKSFNKNTQNYKVEISSNSGNLKIYPIQDIIKYHGEIRIELDNQLYKPWQSISVSDGSVVKVTDGKKSYHITIEKADSNNQVADSSVPDDFTNDLWLNADFKTLGLDDTYKIVARRIPEIIDNPINNNVTLPNFNYEIIEGNSVTVNDDGLITAEKLGTSIIKVTYDEKNANGKTYPATSIVNTAYMVIDVIDDTDTGIKITTNIDESTFDTLYYDSGDTLEYKFKVTAKNADSIVVTCNGNTLSKSGSKYVAQLENRSNIIGITATNEIGTRKWYQIIDARAVDINIKNKSNPGEDVKVGDTVEVSFKGITLPISKLATIYNPAFKSAWGGNYTQVVYDCNPIGELRGGNTQYDLAQYNAITFTANTAGTYKFTDGHINEEWWGDAAGSHRDKSSPGQPNLNADIRNANFSTLPNFEIEVAPAPEAMMLAAPLVEEPVVLVEEVTPAVEAEQAPAAEAEQVPVVEEEQVPTAEAERAPVVEAEQAPVAREEQVPAIEEEQAPAAEEEQAPAAEEEQVPVVEEEQAPVAEEDQTPAVEEEQVPVAEEEQAPAVEEEQVPVAEEEQAPAAEEEQAPVAEEEQVPVAEEEQAPATNVEEAE